MIRNRRRKQCFDGWEHLNVVTGEWMCGKKLIDKKNRLRGMRYVRGIRNLNKKRVSEVI